MARHTSTHSNVCCHELLPRTPSFEHCLRARRGPLLLCMELPLKQPATAAGECVWDTCMRWRVNPLLWLTVWLIEHIINT